MRRGESEPTPSRWASSRRRRTAPSPTRRALRCTPSVGPARSATSSTGSSISNVPRSSPARPCTSTADRPPDIDPTRKEGTMPFVKVGTETPADIEIHYNDHGTGKPIVLIHGYPLNGNSWERQERVLLANGYRCITYDRRGFGKSSQPATGFDYDTFAADLKSLLDHLALDQDVVLAGFSMGTGEVVRYLGTYGSAGVSKAVLIASIPPFLLQTEDNSLGVPGEVFDGIKEAIVADRYAYFDAFFADFYNTDVLAPERIGDATWRASCEVAASS